MQDLLRFAAWPFLLLSSCAILAAGFARDGDLLVGGIAIKPEVVYFNLSYAWIFLWLFLLERRLPYRTAWQRNDGQIPADLGHTLLNKGLVQFTIIQLMGLPFFQHREASFMSAQPLLVQAATGLLAAEFGLYWAHRWSHEWPLLWRFHAVHHSVKRLWIINTGRFHFVDSNLSVLASMPFLLLSEISMDAIILVSAVTAYIGVLTHCNVATRCGWLSYVFNTPNLHRWHHSTVPSEGNANYGQNLMLWDQLFGTFFVRPDSRLGAIGIAERMPRGFLGQLYVPFVWGRYQRET
jgi:sterol desaturase/sphingolipid hydroxylase (fatty acid hydroxylase superfamily)